MSDPQSDPSAPIQVAQLGTLGIEVSNRAAWLDFATAVLGLQENGRSPAGDLLLRMDARHHRFVLSNGDKDDLSFLGWEVKDAAALVTMGNQLRARGIQVSEGSREMVAERMVAGMIAYVDPDGIPTEISFGALRDHTPFVSPRGIGSFIADELGFGHVVIAVGNVPRYVDYLTNVLGARVSDYINIPIGPMTLSITFLHVNARHHTIAVAPKLPIPGASDKRLQHMMIEADSIDAVGHAFDLFQKRQMPVGTLGRHTNDRMFSFYGKTPSGFDIEYGYGGIQIRNEAEWVVQSWNAPSIWGHSMPGQPPHM